VLAEAVGDLLGQPFLDLRSAREMLDDARQLGLSPRMRWPGK